MGHWAEIRNNFFESENEINQALDGELMARISIDAWMTERDDEEGTVIARVMLSKHGDVLVDYLNVVARIDEAAQWAIRDASEQLKEYYVTKEKENCTRDLVVRLVEFMKDYDFYHFMDSLEVGGEKAAIGKIEQDLKTKGGFVSYMYALCEILYGEELTDKQEVEAKSLIEDLRALGQGMDFSASLEEKMKNAESERRDSVKGVGPIKGQER